MSSTDELDVILETLISAEVRKIESQKPPTNLFKFYPLNRLQEFSIKPAIRFTQPKYLNDAFEFSKRWKTQLSDNFIKKISRYIELKFRRTLADPDILVERFFLNKRTIDNTPTIRKLIKEFLSTSQGKNFLHSAQERFFQFIPILQNELDKFSADDNILERLRERVGVFSMSENLLNEQLWSLYADEGRGFAVGLKTDTKLFLSESGNNLIKKVTYTDQNIPSLIENPYFLYLVKKKKWGFEQEWRALKELLTADRKIGDEIYLWNLNTGTISSVNFGYKMDLAECKKYRAELLNFDSTLVFQRMVIDNDNLCLKVIEFN